MTVEINELLEYANGGKKIACYGAGDFGRQTVAFLMEKGKEIAFFVETDPKGCNEKFGIEVKRLSDIGDPLNYRWIVGVSKKYQEEVTEMLKSRGVVEYYCVNDILIAAIREETLKKNAGLKDIGKGKRCFIMGMGPTISQQDLKLLKNEVVFSCSWCCLLDDYNEILPEYYVSPAIMNDPTNGDAERFVYGKEAYQFRDETIKSKIIVLDYKDKAFVEGLGVFKDKDVYYIDQLGKWDGKYDYCELTRRGPDIQTASIMMLKVAIFMGFSEIYLLGTEHDIIKRVYNHSYDINKLKELGYVKLHDMSVFHGGFVEKKWPNRELLRVSYVTYEEYYQLHLNAADKGISIYNATAGGELDEFERVDFEKLFG